MNNLIIPFKVFQDNKHRNNVTKTVIADRSSLIALSLCPLAEVNDIKENPVSLYNTIQSHFTISNSFYLI